MVTSCKAAKLNELFGKCVLLLACGYGIVLFFQLYFYPLVRSPQLDARENLVLAEVLFSADPLSGPFYRAMLYPFLLSLFAGDEARVLAGYLFGMLCHLLNGFIVFALARQWWESLYSGILAAILYVLNPASLFYAGLLLDITPGITLVLTGLFLMARKSTRAPQLLLAGFLLGLAILIRPHFLLIAIALPFLLLGITKDKPLPLLSLLPVCLLLLGQGVANQVHSGDFRILPWQGSYNLWAANKPGANGLYYKQELDLSGRGSDINPARLESIILYGEAHPEDTPPYSIDKMNAYWRGKFIDHALANPGEILKLWLFKGYAVLNSFEQYNNLTFSFHKERIPLLRYNPLNWGILLILGICGTYFLFRYNLRAAWLFTGCALCYAAMLILFYASARFRLPLVPFLAIAAGGIPVWGKQLLLNRGASISVILIVLAAGLLTYSNIGNIRSKDTYIQDKLLLSNAHVELGNDREAAEWALEALEDQPTRPEALRTYAVSYFNMAITGAEERTQFGDWKDQRSRIRQTPPTDPVQDAVLGVFYWQWGEQEVARATWKQIVDSHLPAPALAQASLRVTDPVNPSAESDIERALFKLLQDHRNP